MSSKLMTQTHSLKTQKASGQLCVSGLSLDCGIFALAQAPVETPWYPTSKRHANPEVGT